MVCRDATDQGTRILILELLQPALARPGRLDDATVARIIRVHQDQAGDLVYFQNQADKGGRPSKPERGNGLGKMAGFPSQ
jgi:hypothetical protein